MSTLLQNGTVVNVFTGELQKTNVLIEDDGFIQGVGDYYTDADEVRDMTGKYICPGFIDGHIHIESTMLLPSELARVCLPHGTTSIVADPHEIANVCGTAGIEFMLKASRGLPMSVYLMLPSCVPATKFDDSRTELTASKLEPFYDESRVVGLAEMMDYAGVLADDLEVRKKIAAAKRRRLTVNGHAPLLTGRQLDAYIAAGIRDDHECSSFEEAAERIRKGQWVMIRQGTAAQNLAALLPLFEEPWAHRCLLVTDDKHPADLLAHGHIDDIIRQAVAAGKDPITAIRMATIQAAECIGLQDVGAVAPGYRADLLVLNDLPTVSVEEVYYVGEPVFQKGTPMEVRAPSIPQRLWEEVHHSFSMPPITESDFRIDAKGVRQCRVIRIRQGELLTEDWVTEVNLDHHNGIDLDRDILKVAVLGRYRETGRHSVGLIAGTGLKCGAIASSVSHDSHNLIVIGTNERDMTVAAEKVRQMGGGYIVVKDGETVCEMPLPVAGLMADAPAEEIAAQNEKLRESVHTLGVPEGTELFMTTAFVSLAVIPHLRITTHGLVDVDRAETVRLIEK